MTIGFAVYALVSKPASISTTAVTDALPFAGCGIPTIVRVAQATRLAARVAITSRSTSTTWLTGRATWVRQCCISTKRILMLGTNIVSELRYVVVVTIDAPHCTATHYGWVTSDVAIKLHH